MVSKTLDSVKSALADMQGKLLEEVKHNLPRYPETSERETGTDKDIYCTVEHCKSRKFSESQLQHFNLNIKYLNLARIDFYTDSLT